MKQETKLENGYWVIGAESWNANPWVWVIDFKQINHENK